MTYVIITAGIDLSVGSVLVFSGVVAAKLMTQVGGDNWGVILVGLAAALASGLAWGLVNGFLVAKAKIPAFIVTLGTFGMALGLALVISGGVDERSVPFKLITTIGIGRAVRPDPLSGAHLARGRDRVRDRSSPRRGSAATRTRSAPTRRRPGAPASTSTAT